MKVLKLLAVILILAPSAFAQKPGFFVSAGGGLAKMDAGEFTVYNPHSSTIGGEPLATTVTKDTVSVARLTVGYNFTENWALQLSYASYGTGEVQVTFPLYTGYEWATGGGAPTYLRQLLKYKPTAFTLMPSYTYALSEKSRLIAGVGVSYSATSSHFEDTTIPGGTVSPANKVPTSYSYAEENEHSLGFNFLLGVNRLITENLSVEITGSYSTFKMKVPTTPWPTSSKSSVNISSFGAELALVWHW